MAFGTPTAGSYLFVQTYGGPQYVPLPTGTVGDILVLMVYRSTFSNINESGWTLLRNGPTYALYWKRRAAGQGSISVETNDYAFGEGSPFQARCFAFSGCVASGSPLDVDAAIVSPAPGQSLSGASVANASTSLLAAIVSGLDDSSFSSVSGGVNAFLDGKLGLAYNVAPAANAPAPVFNWATGLHTAEIYTFALKPEAGGSAQTYTETAPDSAAARDLSSDAIHQHVASEVVSDTASARDLSQDSAPVHAGFVSAGAFVACPGNGTVTVPLPVGIVAGDWLVGVGTGSGNIYNGSFNAWTAPTLYLWVKQYTVGTGAPTLIGNGGAAQAIGARIYAFRGYDATTLLDAYTMNVGRATPGVTAVRSNDTALFFYRDSFSNTLPGTVTGPATIPIDAVSVTQGGSTANICAYQSPLTAGGAVPGAAWTTGAGGGGNSSAGVLLLLRSAPAVIQEAPADAASAADATADSWHQRIQTETVSDAAQAREAPSIDPYPDHTPGPMAEAVSDAARAADQVINEALNVQMDVQFAAFGGTDPYSGAQKARSTTPSDAGVITRPGEPYLGRRLNLGKASGADPRGDRAFFSVKRSDVPKVGPSIGRATLFLTPVVVGPYDDTVPVEGPLARWQNIAGTLDLSTCTADAALDAPLSGDLGTIQMRDSWSPGDDSRVGLNKGPTWLCGGRGYKQGVTGRPQDPWEFDWTGIVNTALAGGTDPIACLNFGIAERSDTKTACEFYGSAFSAFRPRLEVDPFGASAIAITEIDTGQPTLTVTVPAGATLVGTTWGYDSGCTQGFTTGESQADVFPAEVPYVFPMLETSARVYAQITLDYGGLDKTVTCERSFFTPKAFRPKLKLSRDMASNATSFDWLDVRRPSAYSTHWFGQSSVWLAKAASGWRLRYLPTQPVCVDQIADAWDPALVHDLGDVQRIPGSADVGHTWVDRDARCLYVPYVNSRLDGKYEIGLCYAPYAAFGTTSGGGNAYDWTPGPPLIWDLLTVVHGRASTKYATAVNPGAGGLIFDSAPSGKLLAMSRAVDFRQYDMADTASPWVMAFVGDGKLHVLVNRTAGSPPLPLAALLPTNPLFGYPTASGWTLAIGPTGSGAANIVDVNPDAEVAFLHGFTRDRQQRLILVARGSGTSLVASLSPDTVTTPSDGSAIQITPGAWTLRTVPSFQAAYVTNPGIRLDGVADAPDFQTAYLALSRSAAPPLLEMLRLDTLLPGVPDNRERSNIHAPASVATEFFMVDPLPWGDCAGNPYPSAPRWYNGRLIDDLPSCAAEMMRTAHGGAVGFDLSGGMLRAQRIYEQARTSEISQIAAPAGATTIYAMAEEADEGIPLPVIVGSPGAWQVVDVTSGMDISRIDAPSSDLRGRYTSGTLDLDNITLPPNAGLRGLTKLTGYNGFAMTWQWDMEALSSYGIMNHAGQAKFRITGGKGQSARIHITNTPVGGGAWIDGNWYPYGWDGYDYDGSPEIIGGLEFPMIRWAPWWISQDGGRTFDRIYGTQWIPDGESSSGGEIVLTLPTLTSDEVVICKEAPSDYDVWQTDVAGWLSRAANARDPAYNLIKNTSPTGELLYLGTDPTKIGHPLSEVENDGYRALRTWDPAVPGNADLLPALPPTDNVFGLLIDWAQADGGTPKSQRRLVVIEAGDDASEQMSHRTARYMVEWLISGSRQAKATLRALSFLFRPLNSQQAIKRGRARYQLDNFDLGGGSYGPIVERSVPPRLAWGGDSQIGRKVTVAAIQEWVSELTPLQQASAAFCLMTLHSDTHNRDTPPPAPMVAPFAQLAFPGYTGPDAQAGVDLFRSRFDPLAFPEFYAHCPNGYQSPITFGNYAGIDISMWGGTTFYFELPWGAVGPKLTYWPGEDTLKNFAEAFIPALGFVGGATMAYDEPVQETVTESDSATSRQVGVEPVADAVQGSDAAGATAIGREQPLDRAITPDASVSVATFGEATPDAALSRDAGASTVLGDEALRDAARESGLSADTTGRTGAGVALAGTATLSGGAGRKATQGAGAQVAGSASLGAGIGKKAAQGSGLALARTAQLALGTGTRQSIGAFSLSAALGLGTGVGAHRGGGGVLAALARLGLGSGAAVGEGIASRRVSRVISASISLRSLPTSSVRLLPCPTSSVELD